MAKQGFKVIDSDIHVVEPKDLGSATSNRNSSKTVRGRRSQGRGCGKSASGRFRFDRIFPAGRKTSLSAGRELKKDTRSLGGVKGRTIARRWI